MMENQKFSLINRGKSFTYAFKGICASVNSQHNLWIHIVIFVMVLAMGIFFNISRYEWLAVLIVSSNVFVAELINTAIEFLVDKISPEWEEKAGMIKDIAAGAVLISAIFAAIVGLLVFVPYT